MSTLDHERWHTDGEGAPDAYKAAATGGVNIPIKHRATTGYRGGLNHARQKFASFLTERKDKFKTVDQDGAIALVEGAILAHFVLPNHAIERFGHFHGLVTTIKGARYYLLADLGVDKFANYNTSSDSSAAIYGW
jgi:hypothetical protein